MNWLQFLMVISLLPLGIPQSSAEDLESTQILSDPVGDVANTVTPYPAGLYGMADYKGLNYRVEHGNLTFELELAGMGETRIPMLDSVYHAIHFEYGGGEYVVRIFRQVPVPLGAEVQVYPEANLLRIENGEWQPIAELQARTDEVAATVSAQLPLHLVREATGVVVHPGSLLEDMFVESYWQLDVAWEVSPTGDPVVVYDRMPDQGSVDLELVYEVEEILALQMSTTDSRRLSNGGPDTLTFPATIYNVGNETYSVELSIRNAPSNWEVSLVDDRFTLTPGDQRETLLVVQIPGRHEHGALEVFDLVATSPTVQYEASLQFGVIFTEIPQPSGHHPQVYIHSLDRDRAAVEIWPWVSVGTGILSTLDLDERGSDEPIDSQTLEPGLTGWILNLSPGLGMGLDFMPNATSELTTTLAAGMEPGGFPDVTTYAWLALTQPDAPDLTLMESESQSLAVTGEHPVSYSLQVLPGIDRIPYQKGAQLQLKIAVDTGESMYVLSGPLLLPGGGMTLPLEEYRDLPPMADSDELVASIVADATRARAGDRLGFEVIVTNAGASERSLQIEVLGGASEIALEATHMQLASGESHSIHGVLSIPETAVPDQLLSYYLVARDDLGSAVTELHVKIDPEAALQDARIESKGSPVAGLTLLLVGMLLMGARKR